MKYLQKFRLNHLLPLEKFFIRVGGGWLMKSVCFCCSEPALDAAREWASRRGWRFLLSEREKKHAAHSLPEWAHFSAPYSSHWWQRRAPSPHWAACVAYSKRSSKKQMEKHRKGWAHFLSSVCDQRCLQLEPEGHRKVEAAMTLQARRCARWSLPSAGGD